MQTTIDNDGVGLAVTTTGDGPDVLLVHGLGSAQVLWRPIVDVLSGRFRCWNMDLRGHGASDRAPGGYTSDGYGSDVAAVLDHIGRPTVGIGHSLGGGSLLKVGAADHPHLKAVCVVDSTIFPADGPNPLLELFRKQLAMIEEFQSENRPVEAYEDRLGAAPYVGGGTNAEAMTPHQLRGRAESLSQLDPECIAVRMSGTRPGTSVEPRLRVPLRVMAADPKLSGAFKPEHKEQLQALTPQAEITSLDGVGHQMMMIRGYDQKVLEALEAWLGSVADL